MQQCCKEIGIIVENSSNEHVVRILNVTYSNHIRLGIVPIMVFVVDLSHCGAH